MEGDPWQVLELRRKLKRYNKIGVEESMKILKKIRNMKLDNKMLQCTEFPRTLLWVANRTSETQDEGTKKLYKMCRFLFKEWKEQLHK